MNDKFRVIDLHQMAGLNDGLHIAVEQLGFKGVIRVGFIAQRAQIVRDMVRAAEQRNDLIQGMHAKAIELAVLRTAGVGLRQRAIIIEMAFDLHQFAEFPALNHLFGGQEAGVETAVLIGRHRQAFAVRQGKQSFCFLQRRGERLFHQHVFPRLQRLFRIFKMAVGVSADHHQLDQWIV